jgi:hypothetical protein
VSVLAERMASLRVRVESPDGNIEAELHDQVRVDLTFRPRRYPQYSGFSLETQLAGTGRLLVAARTRAYFAALSEAAGYRIEREERPVGPRDVAFAEARDALVASGASPDDRIRIAVRGMRDWSVEIAPGALRRLDEAEFADRVRSAVADLIEDQFRRIAHLRREIYAASWRGRR